MHGRENACSPVFICRQAPLWLMLSATIERMTHRLSKQVANCGNSSLTSVTDWPCFSKVYGEASRFAVLVRSNFGFSTGRGLPASCSSRGIGSNVSTGDVPPARDPPHACPLPVRRGGGGRGRGAGGSRGQGRKARRKCRAFSAGGRGLG